MLMTVMTLQVRRHSAMKPAKPRELLYSRHINQEDPKTEDNLEDWKVISCTSIEGVSILSLITIDGHLFTCSIIQRVNNSRSNSPPAFIPADQAAAQAAVAATAATAPATLSRPSSQDKDVFEPLATMNQAKCVGTGCLDGKLVVCGECLSIPCFASSRSPTALIRPDLSCLLRWLRPRRVPKQRERLRPVDQQLGGDGAHAYEARPLRRLRGGAHIVRCRRQQRPTRDSHRREVRLRLLQVELRGQPPRAHLQHR